MSKILSGSNTTPSASPSEIKLPAEASAPAVEHSFGETARIIGQPEGPFGTAAVARLTVLMRSVGAARFAKFESLELAQHGLFVSCANPKQNPYQAKTTLLELQIFLGDPASPATRLIKALGRIEETRAAADLPLPTPAGYVVRLLQVSLEDARTLEKYLHEHLLRAAM